LKVRRKRKPIVWGRAEGVKMKVVVVVVGRWIRGVVVVGGGVVRSSVRVSSGVVRGVRAAAAVLGRWVWRLVVG